MLFFIFSPKLKDWNKSRQWLKPPESGIVEDDKVSKLQNCLKKLGESESLDELEKHLDWENNKPKNKLATVSFDPYYPLRGENNITVNQPENVETLRDFTGKCHLTLSNGDKFVGNFEEGERQGQGKAIFV